MAKEFTWIGRGVLTVGKPPNEDGKVPRGSQLFGEGDPLPAHLPPEFLKKGLANGTIIEMPKVPDDLKSEDPPEDTDLDRAQQAVTDATEKVTKAKARMKKADTPAKTKNAQKALSDANAEHEAALEAWKALQGDD